MNKGFTLVEVISVIVIIGIIATITIPQIFNVIENSRQKAYASNVENLLDDVLAEEQKAASNMSTYILNTENHLYFSNVRSLNNIYKSGTVSYDNNLKTYKASNVYNGKYYACGVKGNIKVSISSC